MPAGGNVGIIRDPLGLAGPPKLVAATRMIPYSFPSELVLSNDGKFLYAGYTTSGAVFAFDVDQIKQTLATASPADLAKRPIDDINPAIDARANFQLRRGSDGRPTSPPTFEVPTGAANGPIATGGLPRGLDVQPAPSEAIAVLGGFNDQFFKDDSGSFTLFVKNDAALFGAGPQSKLRVKLVVHGNSGANRFLDRPSGAQFTTMPAFVLNPQQTKTITVNLRDLLTDMNVNTATENSR